MNYNELIQLYFERSTAMQEYWNLYVVISWRTARIFVTAETTCRDHDVDRASVRPVCL